MTNQLDSNDRRDILAEALERMRQELFKELFGPPSTPSRLDAATSPSILIGFSTTTSPPPDDSGLTLAKLVEAHNRIEQVPTIRILQSDHLTIAETHTVPRSWRERWLTWPWRPWQATKTITTRRPDPHLYQFKSRGIPSMRFGGIDLPAIGDNEIVMVGHPDTVQAAMKALADNPNQIFPPIKFADDEAGQ